jgi:ketosteroid isomerase-like protein
VSQENVEVVKGVFDAWNAGDKDRLRDMYDQNVVMQTVPDWPEPGPYVGREAVMGFFKRLRETWDSDAVEPNRGFIEVADHVLVRHTWRGQGRGPDLNMATTLIFTLRRGKVIYHEYFWDHDEALKAVGLEDG